MSNIDKLKRRAAAILNQAANAANEHEKRVFQEKAFALMAEYGLSEAELRAMSSDPGKVVVKTFRFPSSYNRARIQLMHRIAEALHCQSTHKTSYRSGMIYGVESHVQRVAVLMELIEPQMLAEIAKTQPWQAGDPDWKTTSYWSAAEKAAITREHRRGFGIGYAETIGIRLFNKEREVINNGLSSGDETHKAGALMLLSDAEKAQKELDRIHNGKKLRVANIRMPDEGYHEGAAAGRKADISGDRSLKTKTAIGA